MSAIWEWSNDSLRWDEYIPAVSQALETAYAANTRSFTFSITLQGQANHSIDFIKHDGWQVDPNGVARALKRSPDTRYSPFSALWEWWDEDNSSWKRFELSMLATIESNWQNCERSKVLNQEGGLAGFKITDQNKRYKFLFATEGIQVNLNTLGMRGVRRRTGPIINRLSQFPPSPFIPGAGVISTLSPNLPALNSPTSVGSFLSIFQQFFQNMHSLLPPLLLSFNTSNSQTVPQLIGAAESISPLASYGQSTNPKGYDLADLVPISNPDKDLTCSICTDNFGESEEDENDATATSTATVSASPSTTASVAPSSSPSNDSTAVKLSKCNHYFHSDCIKEWFKQKPMCPICLAKYGNFIGTQPTEGAVMHVLYHSYDPTQGWEIDGFPSTDVIEIVYVLEDGIQGPEHPNPGQQYKGTIRRAFLPKNSLGEEVLDLLKEAWRRRLIFHIGTSLTSGLSNRVVWGCVHHKTNLSGGTSRFGYPDNCYFVRVKAELADLGVF